MNKRTDVPELPKFMKAAEVAELLECSKSKAYKIMQKLNKELEAAGSITVAGRVSRKYLMERLYC